MVGGSSVFENYVVAVGITAAAQIASVVVAAKTVAVGFEEDFVVVVAAAVESFVDGAGKLAAERHVVVVVVNHAVGFLDSWTYLLLLLRVGHPG